MTIPALVPSQDRVCAICGASETYSPQGEPHHIIPRSLGGLNGPTLEICLSCHNRVDATGEWHISVTDNRDGVSGWIYVLDQHNHIVCQRPREYLSADLTATMLGSIQAVPAELERYSHHFDRLPDYALEPIAQAVTGVHSATWGVIGRLLRVVKYRIPYGQKGEQFQRIAASFDLSDKRAYAYIEAVDFTQAHPELFPLARKVTELPLDVVLEAKKHNDPAAVLETYDALRAESPRAGVTALRRVLADRDDVHQVQYCQCECPKCGRLLNHEAGR